MPAVQSARKWQKTALDVGPETTGQIDQLSFVPDETEIAETANSLQNARLQGVALRPCPTSLRHLRLSVKREVFWKMNSISTG